MSRSSTIADSNTAYSRSFNAKGEQQGYSFKQTVIPAAWSEIFNQASQGGDHKNPTPYTYDKTVTGCVRGHWNVSTYQRDYSKPGEAYYRATTYELTGAVLLVGVDKNVDSSQAARVYNACLDGLSAQMRGNLDWSINAFEAGKTLKLAQVIRKLGKTAWDAAHPGTRAGKRGRRKLKHNWGSDSPANVWLSWQYGIKPLMNDLYETADRFIMPKAPPRSMFTSRSSGDTSTSVVSESSAISTNVATETHYRRSVRYEVAVFVGPPTASSVAAEWTSMNPANIAWELMPYSFVIDWFVDVGGYLRTAENALANSTRFQDGYVTRTVRNVVTTTIRPRKGSNTKTYYNSAGGSGMSVYSSSNRQRLLQMPVPDLPRFDPHLGWQRILSAASLLTQAATRNRRD